MDKQQEKEELRRGRLTWSRTAENKLRDELHAEARRLCKAKLDAFQECAAANGFMVVFRCQEQNKAMNACLREHTTTEALERLKKEREAQFESS